MAIIPTVSALEPTTREVILVVGMHRSGTSLITRIINLMGGYIGDDDEMIPAHPEINPAGYWERSDLAMSHELFLQESGFRWDKLAEFDLAATNSSRRQELTAHLCSLCARIGHVEQPLLLKDPRLCLLLPLWRSIAPAVKYVFAVRDPHRVAASMMKREPGAYTTSYLLALWQKYVQSALLELVGQRVLFVDYERVLGSSKHETARIHAGLLELGIEKLVDPDTAQLADAVHRELNRSVIAPHTDLSAAQKSLCAWLLEQAAAPGPVQIHALPPLSPPDPVLQEFQALRDHYYQRAWGFFKARAQEQNKQ